RHTRWPRDWSSDVCSSDLSARAARTPPPRGSAGSSSAPGQRQYEPAARRRSRLAVKTANPLRTVGLAIILSWGWKRAAIALVAEIGRASCRERVERWEGAG